MSQKTALQFEKQVTNALDKLPAYEGNGGVVYRGTDLKGGRAQAKEMYKVGETVEHEGFTSTSVGREASFGGDIRYVIKGKNGKRIEKWSEHDHEQEVLFKPNTKFKVLKVTENATDFTVHLREI